MLVSTAKRKVLMSFTCDRLPIGFAGVLAGCFGVAGAVVGMSEVWYTGPLGKDAGAEFGADLGFEVSFRCVTVPTGDRC